MKIPENLIALASHGAWRLPDSYYDRVSFNRRLLRNFSDFGTAALIESISPERQAVPANGRIIGDPNRSPQDPELFRETDFGGLKVWRQPPTDVEQDELLNLSYRPYQQRISELLKANHGHEQDQLLVVDVHDTGNLIMGKTPEEDRTRQEAQGWTMVPVILSDRDGRSSNDQVTKDLQQAFQLHFQLSGDEVQVNTRYKGKYVCEAYGRDAMLENPHHPSRHVIQIELLRSMFLEEKTQRLLRSGVMDVRNKLTKVLAEVADGLRKEAR